MSVKDFLEQWAERNLKTKPKYKVHADDNGLFTCNLRLAGFYNRGLGSSTSEEGARTAAAAEFCEFLIRIGRINKSEVPPTDFPDDCADNTTSSRILDDGSCCEQPMKLTIIEGNASDKEAKMAAGGDDSETSDRIEERDAVDQPIRSPESTLDDFQYDPESDTLPMEEKIPKTISDSVKLDEFGGWNEVNSRKAVSEYLHRTKQRAHYFFWKLPVPGASVSIKVPETGQTVRVVGEGSSKDDVKAACAMALARQLYRMKILREYGAPTRFTSPESAKKSAEGALSRGDSAATAPKVGEQLGETIENNISDKKTEMTLGDRVFEEAKHPSEFENSNLHSPESLEPPKIVDLPESISVDIEVSELGGWNKKNSKQALSEYLKKTGQKPQQYKIQALTLGSWPFSAETSLRVPNTGQIYSAIGLGSSSNDSKASCATALVHELYRMKIVPEWNQMNSKTALTSLLQSAGQPPVVYNTFRNKSKKPKLSFSSEISVFVPRLEKSFCVQVQSNNVENAEEKCAKTMVRKLYRAGISKRIHFQRKFTNGGSNEIVTASLSEETAEMVSRDGDFDARTGIDRSGVVEESIPLPEPSPELPKKTSEIDSDDESDSETDKEDSDFVEDQPKSISGLTVKYKTVKKSKSSGWNAENSPKALEEFCEKSFQPRPVYKTEKAKQRKSKIFVSSLTIFLSGLGKQVTSLATHAVTEAAKARCAVAMARQLYRMGLLEKSQRVGGNARINELLKAGAKDRGGWNRENSKQGLDEYLQKTRQQPVVYKKSTKTTKKGKVSFIVSASVVAASEIDCCESFL